MNKKVAEKLGIRFTPRNGVLILSATKLFNPCNNPSDAWQLLLDAKLSIHPDFHNDCQSWVARNVHIPMVNETNLARAISIAYLLFKDADNENNNNS
nr:DUF2591 family protein [Providencia rettgeri]